MAKAVEAIRMLEAETDQRAAIRGTPETLRLGAATTTDLRLASLKLEGRPAPAALLHLALV
jgi:hypothetical protein